MLKFPVVLQLSKIVNQALAVCDFVRKRLGGVVGIAEQIYFVGNLATQPSHVDDGPVAQLVRAPAS